MDIIADINLQSSEDEGARDWLYIGVHGQGGHWLNKFLKVEKITFPANVSKVSQIPPDTPFKAIVTIKSLKGKFFPKLNESSMFPKNWSLQRIQEEVAWVYENTVVKYYGLNPDSHSKKLNSINSMILIISLIY